MKLFITNLNSSGALLWLRTLLNDLQIFYEPEIRFGELTLPAFVPSEKLMQFKTRLQDKGFEILYDRKRILVEQVKLVVADMLNELPLGTNYSTYISNKLYLNYTYLANVFSEMEAITVEHYIIERKIVKAKQLLLFSNNSVSEVAEILHYSSIGHFSNQFKKATGLTPSEFKRIHRQAK